MPRGVAPDNRGQLPDVVDVFASNNVRAALLGAFLTCFHGVWLDMPENMQRADNKLLQLRVAQQVGLQVPRTLVSQDPQRIRAFADSVGGPIIAKTVAGMLGVPALTGEVTEEQLAMHGSLMACPSIYQELIPGRRHLRVNCFGEDIRCALITSDSLDWRLPLNVDMEPFSLSSADRSRLLNVLAEFGLQMGVIDMKLTEDGGLVWLELNPQGQFLFVEALGGGDLVGPFARFLIHLARRH
jgi:glutathione synthase/RimK-type ligase-like ATP-grasp enzyme